MEILRKNGNLLLREENLVLSETLDCGQAFRFEKQNCSEDFYGFFTDKPLHIYAEKDYFVLENVTENEFHEIWYNYFDLATDYAELKRQFSQDETLAKACEFAKGIRLLRQDSFEALFSFIISQNNNIPRIKLIISRLCERYGGFPTAKMLAENSLEDYDFLKAGFRGKYLHDCVSRINSGEISLEAVAKMDVISARTELMKIKGVGPKVAECALLYGMYRTECFPVDVWIKRVLEQFYPNGFPEYLQENAGIAQQFLFHYVRNIDKL